jgi:hypothetical protein
MQSPSSERRHRHGRALVALIWLAASAAAVTTLLIAAAVAEGGVYRAAQCNPGLGAGHSDLDFDRNSDHYAGSAGCQDGEGVSVRHAGHRSGHDRWGAWGLSAPAGAELEGVTVRVSGIAAAGHQPELLIGLPGSRETTFGDALGSSHAVRWRGERAESFAARLRCVRPAGCGEGAVAKLRLRRLMLRLSDREAPATELAGRLAGDATQRGTRRLRAIVADAGGGVRRVFVSVNGSPVAARKLECALERRVATRLRPCPAASEPDFDLDTAAAPFRQGPNNVRACALDYAGSGERNRDCASRRVRIDNACPVDDTAEAGRLETRIAGARADGSVDHGESARLVGRLTDGSGGGIGGAKVCVATRADLHGAPERVVATPTTGADGRFEVRLRPGPSREVRTAHWADDTEVAESYERLGVRAKPSLSLSPSGTVPNGRRVHFDVRLHGPEAGGRRVHVKARSGGRWVKVRTGNADRNGRWRAAYRFRSTTGTRTYSFKAFVPRQAGYPFDAGRSAARKVTVSG